MRIQALCPHVANQIAAGEVIERPASVVKELLENALDAGASTITIDIGFGGLNLIKIADDGHGIDADDLVLAITAHATSKITELADLYAINTMGFRGEALASIAAISRMKLYSKPAAQTHGMLLQVNESGIHTQAYARTQGTTIEVCDLFFNAPVRKTFLKSERLEYQAIELVVKQFALSAPQIAITLHHNQKQIVHLPKVTCEQSRLRRIKKLFGQAFLDDAVYIQEEHDGFAMMGWISQRTYQRSQRDRQWVYLNQRLIKDKLLLQAIGQAYQDILYPGRYPSCVLYLSVPPDQVDVNVHPTKHEVRFRQPRLIHGMIVSGLANRLHVPSSVTNMQVKAKPKSKPFEQLLYAAMPHVLTESEPTWIIINSQFALVHLHQPTPYLLDLAAIHHHQISYMLRTLPKPFPHRALLVPVRLDIHESVYPCLEQERSSLLDVGIQFDFISSTQILIRTIPLHIPLLDIQRFFSEVLNINRDTEAMLKQLIACQTFDAYNLSPIERNSLLDYCIHQWDTMHTIQACLHLDSSTCRHIMHQSRICTPESALLS